MAQLLKKEEDKNVVIFLKYPLPYIRGDTIFNNNIVYLSKILRVLWKIEEVKISLLESEYVFWDVQKRYLEIKLG
jgi:hypothetical protein